LFVSTLGLFLALRWSQRALAVVELSLFIVTSMGLLSRFYEVLFLLNTPLDPYHIAAFSDLFYWFPLVYVLAFLTFETRRSNIIGSTLFFIAALVIGLISGLQDWLSGDGPKMIYLLSRFYMANITYIILLWVSVYINEYSIRGRTLAEAMERLALTDHLTEIANRRQLDEVVLQEISQVQRYEQALSGIMFDLDHFKQVNDTYGHDIGDYVLKEVVRTARPLLRPADLIGRWGGEEFFIIARHTNIANARILAERLRQAIAAHEFKWIGSITASFGVAEYYAGEKVDDWLKRTDTALYQAKHEGRNKVNIAK